MEWCSSELLELPRFISYKMILKIQYSSTPLPQPVKLKEAGCMPN